MSLIFSKTPQVIYYGDSGRISERSNPSWQQRFPAHARPAQQAPDAPGPYGGGCWKIYTETFDPKQPQTFGFKHRNQWYMRVQRRNPVNAALEWVTEGQCNPVMFSS